MKRIIVFIGTLVAAITIMAQSKVIVNINEVKSNKGNIYINLYNNEDGFPGEWSKAFKQQKLEAKSGMMAYTFEDVPFGVYAVSIAHDENGNGKLDSNFIGFPKESVGASNQTGFGKPSFNRSKFELSETNPSKTLKMKFLN